jgi:hypothetical protein
MPRSAIMIHQIPQAQFKARVPPDIQDEDLPAEMPPFEHCLDWVEPLHSPSSQVTARLHQNRQNPSN